MKKLVAIGIAVGVGFTLVSCSTPEAVVVVAEPEQELELEVTEAPPLAEVESEPRVEVMPEPEEAAVVRPDTLEGNICMMFDTYPVETAWTLIYLTGSSSGNSDEFIVTTTQTALKGLCPEYIDAVIELAG